MKSGVVLRVIMTWNRSQAKSPLRKTVARLLVMANWSGLEGFRDKATAADDDDDEPEAKRSSSRHSSAKDAESADNRVIKMEVPEGGSFV